MKWMHYNVSVENTHEGELIAQNVTLPGLLWSLFWALPAFYRPRGPDYEQWHQIVIRMPKRRT